MTIRIDTPIRTCLWRLYGRCFRRMKHRIAAANGNCAPPGCGKPPTTLDLLDFIRGKHSIDELPKCDEVPGSPCPHLPIFDGLVLSFRGEAVLTYERRCRQSKLHEACQLQGWTDVIQMPHWPEKRLSKIVFELNKRQRRRYSRQRIHFWCGDSGVHWKIAGDGPARFLAPAGPAPMVKHD